MAIVAQNGRIFDPMIDNIIEFVESSYPEIRATIILKENL
jgi:hypothetical protein